LHLLKDSDGEKHSSLLRQGTHNNNKHFYFTVSRGLNNKTFTVVNNCVLE
jgi:hypothetical protein